MENAYGKIISILLVSFMLFVLPVKYAAEKADSFEKMYVNTKTIEFVDAVRNTGFITEDMYAEYITGLSRLNGIYEIRMERFIYGVPDQFGNIIKEYSKDEQIRVEINSGKIYQFAIGDYFKIQVFEKSSNTVVTYYGGYIRNEII